MSPDSVTLTKSDSEPAQSPCARQLQQGESRLRFEPRLEAEFRRVYIDQNIDRVRAAVWLGIALVVTVVAIDLFTLAPEIRLRVAAAKLLILMPVPALTLWVVYHPILYRFAAGFMAASIVTVGLGIAAIHAVVGQMGFVQPYDSLLLAVVFTYFMSGLLLPMSAICALVISMGAILGEVQVGIAGASLAYHVTHLTAANMIGLIGSFMLERVVRQNYLHAGAANELAGLDVLTNLPNLRVFNDRFERRWRQASSESASLGLLLVDVDYFKRYNDSAGHVAADKAIQQVAKCIQRAARRPIDIVGRLDDDEFAILLYAADQAQLAESAAQLVQAVRGMHIHHADSPISDQLTISIGAAAMRARDAAGPALLVAQADEALQLAKRSDRNQACVANPQQAPADNPKVTPLRAS